MTAIGATRSALVVRRASWSVRLHLRSIVIGLALVVATLVIAIWSIMVGDFPVSVRQVLRAVVGDGGKDAEFIVQTLRLPRALTAMMVGAAWFGFGDDLSESQRPDRRSIRGPSAGLFESAIVADQAFRVPH